jgi:hypothetical protein
MGEGGVGGRGAKSFDRQKAWPSIKSFNTLWLLGLLALLASIQPKQFCRFLCLLLLSESWAVAIITCKKFFMALEKTKSACGGPPPP